MTIDGSEPVSDSYGSWFYIIDTNSGKVMHLYAGYRLGEFDPTYNGTKDNLLGDEYKTDLHENEGTMTVWFFPRNEAICREDEYLHSVDARNNPAYFNETNGGGDGLQGTRVVEKVQKIIDKYDAGGYPIIRMTLDKILILPWYQTRYRQHVIGHVPNITARLNDNEGKSIKNVKPIPALQNFDGEGKHSRIGHKHITDAADKSKKIVNSTTEMEVALIAEADTADFTEDELILLGLSFNKEPEEVHESNDKYDWANLFLRRNILYGHPPNHVSNKDILRSGRVPTAHNDRIYKAAQKLIDEQTASEKNQIVNDWKGDDVLVALKTLAIKKIESKEKRKVIEISSDREKALKRILVEELVKNGDEIETYIILVRHPSDPYLDAWPDVETEVKKIFNYIKQLIKKAHGKERRLYVVHLPYTRENDAHRDTRGDVTIGTV